MYSQFQNNNNSQAKSFSSAGSMTSQFANNQQKYQPIGYVQSQYNGQTTAASNNRFASSYQPQAQTQAQTWSHFQPQAQSQSHIQSQAQSQNQFQPQFTQSSQFHTANYRGNQPGHDTALKSEYQSAQSQFGSAVTSNALNQQQAAFNQQSYQPSFQSASSFHQSNYRGNQPGHDLKNDSAYSAQNQYSSGAASFNTFGSSSFGMR